MKIKDRKWKIETDNNFPEDVKAFIKPEMTNSEIGTLGVYLIKERFRKIKLKIKGVFKHEKNKTDN